MGDEMTDNTLNGALEALGELMAENLEVKNVQANASDGLTTLANKILNIPPKMFVIVTGDSFRLGSQIAYTGQVNIDWGDGTIETNVNPNNRSHTYTDNVSSHIITVTGKISSIGNDGFKNSSRLNSIVIPDSVTFLGEGCFRKCLSLTSIIIPNSVTTVDAYCFQDSPSLTSVTIPNSITTISAKCFYNCSSLTSVAIPNSVTRLDPGCFWGCSNLTSVTIPDSVTYFGNSCFYKSGVIDYELYWTGEDIITYESTMMPNKTDTFFYIPIGTKTEYINKGYPANKLIERGYQLIITSDKSIILSGEQSTITAKLVNNEQPLSSESLSYIIKHDETTIDSGTVTTDSNGEVEITYTGTGVGEVNITIEYGTLLQETYEVLDCLFVDDGITDPKPSGSWIRSGTGSQLTIDDNGTTLYATSEGIYRNTTLINGDFEAIWEAKSTGGVVRYGVRNESSPFQYTQFMHSTDDFLYYKLKRVGSTFTGQYSNDGVNWTNCSLESSNVTDNDCYFMFRVMAASSDAPRTITYKNLRIYPI